MKSTTLPIIVFLLIWIQLALTKNGIFDVDYADDADFSNKYESVILQDTPPSTKALFLQKEKLVPMMLGNEQFLCHLPTPVSLDKQNTKPSQERDVENVAFSILQASLDGSCYYRFTGWWIYEYCHNKHVRQFHQEQDKGVTMEFYLGHFTTPAVSTLDPSTKQTLARAKFKLALNRDAPEESYAKINYGLGTVCDLTKKHREIEIRFYCPAEDKVTAVLKQQGQAMGAGQKIHFIESIEEPSSCNYLMKIYTTSLCDVEGFVKKGSQTNKVRCMSTPWGAPITIEESAVPAGIPTAAQPSFQEYVFHEIPKPAPSPAKGPAFAEIPEDLAASNVDPDLLAAIKNKLATKGSEQPTQTEQQAQGQHQATQPKVVRLNFKLDMKKDPKELQEELTKILVDSLKQKETEPKKEVSEKEEDNE